MDDILYKLSKSKFRSSFHLKEKNIAYINEKGLDKIEEHAFAFINDRLAKANNPKDGKQTPMRGHPVFIAQHATGTCCRKCLYKWHHIDEYHDLTKEEIDYIVKVIMAWINHEVNSR
jgi:hypothetical protein